MTAPPLTDESALQQRIAGLEFGLGDLDDPGNPLGTRQFLAADAAGRILPAADRLADEFGLGAEVVPTALGGRFTQLDAFARVLRVIFRRDAALGLGRGMTALQTAAVVWAGGDEQQRRSVAESLLAGGRLACAYPAPDGGNAFLSNQLTVVPGPHGRRLLSGRKEALNNAGEAGALLLFAADEAGRTSAFLVDGEVLGAGGTPARLLPRRVTSGVRGCVVRGVEFRDLPLEPDALVGEEGNGRLLADRAFPVLRVAGPAMALGSADTALRTTVAFARAHRARSRASLQTPRTRAALVGAFADLLLCDCLALTAARAVHLLPGHSQVLAAAVKYLLPTVLTDALYDLSVVLGSEAHSDHGGHGAFRKSARDLPMIGLGGGGSAASRRELVRHLTRDPTLRAPAAGCAPPELFTPFGDRLPPLASAALTARDPGDPLVAALVTDALPDHPELAVPARELAAELADLRDAATAALPPGAGEPGLRAHALVDRYALLAAGAAALGVWRHAGPDGGFLGDPAWAAVVLHRLVARLGAAPEDGPGPAAERLLDELLHRFDDARSYDLYATAVGR
ncbi:acyl-CoA dehydrogenase family protein [Streptomyces sp. NPDC056817]|uniref:acyl-CoA dehydrogenase family protein n=1 Tax=Streptomyces sp. NPDC056817 TaxID=3345950 RepID=UPI0036B3D0CB